MNSKNFEILFNILICSDCHIIDSDKVSNPIKPINLFLSFNGIIRDDFIPSILKASNSNVASTGNSVILFKAINPYF